MIRTQKRAILFVVLACLILGGVLAVLFATVWKPSEEGSAESVFLADPLDMDEIAEVSVKNETGSWRLYRGEDDQLYFEGAENVLYNQTMIAYLRSCVAYLESLGQVEHPEEMEEYALTEASCLASFSVTSTKGDRYEVLVGEKLVGTQGYYARLADSDEVHVLSSSLERCLFGDLSFFLSGQVAIALSESDYYEISHFQIDRGGKKFVEIERIPEEELTEQDLSTHRVVYPAHYEPNTDLVTRIFKSLVSFVGEVERYNVSEYSSEEFERIMKAYGFLHESKAEMYCRLAYTYHEEETELYVSRTAEEEGLVYVYSPGFDIIASFSAESLEWLWYDLMEYTQAEIFAEKIDRVESITVEGEDVSAVFTLTHGKEAADLVVRSDRGAVNTQDFRQFYTQILYVKNVGYASPEGDWRESLSLTIKIKLTDGEERTFAFYDIETLKSYYQVDGEGVFYVNRDYVKKILEDAAKLLSEQEVSAVQYT